MHAAVVYRFSGTVRIATEADLPAIVRLLETSPDHAGEANEIADDLVHTGYAFVLDGDDGELAAIAHLRLDPPRGRLDLVIVAPRPDRVDLEARMIGIAAALCSAFQLDAMDVAGRRH
jgi:hypothetical protein